MDPNQNQEQQQKRGFIDQGNRLASVAGKLGKRYGKSSIQKKIKMQVIKKGLIALLSNPIGWIILLVIGIITLVLIIVLFFTGGGNPPPPSAIACTTVPGASCQPSGTTCPIINGEQTVADVSARYTCSSTSGTATAGGEPAQTCCLPPSRPGYFIPPFACGLKYRGYTYDAFYSNGVYYDAHTDYAVDFRRAGGVSSDGDPVRASADGHIRVIWPSNGEVIITHVGGFETRYAHMKNIIRYISQGDNVIAGQQIGEIDNTGRSTGTHLHVGHYKDKQTPIQVTYYGIPYSVSVSPPRDLGPGEVVTGPCP